MRPVSFLMSPAKPLPTSTSPPSHHPISPPPPPPFPSSFPPSFLPSSPPPSALPPNSAPLFSTPYTLFSIHNSAHPFSFVNTAHSLPKTPGGSIGIANQIFGLSSISLATPLESALPRNPTSPPTNPIESTRFFTVVHTFAKSVSVTLAFSTLTKHTPRNPIRMNTSTKNHVRPKPLYPATNSYKTIYANTSTARSYHFTHNSSVHFRRPQSSTSSKSFTSRTPFSCLSPQLLQIKRRGNGLPVRRRHLNHRVLRRHVLGVKLDPHRSAIQHRGLVLGCRRVDRLVVQRFRRNVFPVLLEVKLKTLPEILRPQVALGLRCVSSLLGIRGLSLLRVPRSGFTHSRIARSSTARRRITRSRIAGCHTVLLVVAGARILARILAVVVRRLWIHRRQHQCHIHEDGVSHLLVFLRRLLLRVSGSILSRIVHHLRERRQNLNLRNMQVTARFVHFFYIRRQKISRALIVALPQHESVVHRSNVQRRLIAASRNRREEKTRQEKYAGTPHPILSTEIRCTEIEGCWREIFAHRFIRRFVDPIDHRRFLQLDAPHATFEAPRESCALPGYSVYENGWLRGQGRNYPAEAIVVDEIFSRIDERQALELHFGFLNSVGRAHPNHLTVGQPLENVHFGFHQSLPGLSNAFTLCGNAGVVPLHSASRNSNACSVLSAPPGAIRRGRGTPSSRLIYAWASVFARWGTSPYRNSIRERPLALEQRAHVRARGRSGDARTVPRTLLRVARGLEASGMNGEFYPDRRTLIGQSQPQAVRGLRAIHDVVVAANHGGDRQRALLRQRTHFGFEISRDHVAQLAHGVRNQQTVGRRIVPKHQGGKLSRGFRGTANGGHATKGSSHAHHGGLLAPRLAGLGQRQQLRPEHHLKHFEGGGLQDVFPLRIKGNRGVRGALGQQAHTLTPTSGATRSFTCSAVKGLRKYPLAPFESASTTRDSLPSVVIITTGTPLASATPARLLRNSRPSMMGMLMSLKIRSSEPFWTSSRASAPFPASTTSPRSRPPCRRARSTILRITAESSTMSTFNFFIEWTSGNGVLNCNVASRQLARNRRWQTLKLHRHIAPARTHTGSNAGVPVHSADHSLSLWDMSKRTAGRSAGLKHRRANEELHLDSPMGRE